MGDVYGQPVEIVSKNKMATKRILNAYTSVNREALVESDDPQALIMILLDELLRAMHIYVKLIETEDSDEKRKTDHLARSLTMLYGLQSCLNFEEGGEIAENLYRLYEYGRLQLIETSRNGKVDGTKTAIDAIEEIREAWSAMNTKTDIQNKAYGS
ncbi:flagellar export chaperone FliS [Alphaproteobacteria bacterium LSUCC0719]